MPFVKCCAFTSTLNYACVCSYFHQRLLLIVKFQRQDNWQLSYLFTQLRDKWIPPMDRRKGCCYRRHCDQPSRVLLCSWRCCQGRLYPGKSLSEKAEGNCWSLPPRRPRFPPICRGNTGWLSRWCSYSSQEDRLGPGSEKWTRRKCGDESAFWENIPQFDARKCTDAIFSAPGRLPSPCRRNYVMWCDIHCLWDSSFLVIHDSTHIY